MTDGLLTAAEAAELAALESFSVPGEWDRLHWLRMRKAGVYTWREVKDLIAEHFPETLFDRDSPWLKRLLAERAENLTPSGEFVTVPANGDGTYGY